MNSTMDPATLTKAFIRAADQLGLSEDIAAILSISAEDAASLVVGARTLVCGSGEWVLAQRFIALYRSLILVLGDAHKAQAWLIAPHHKLEPAPAVLLRSEEGRDRLHRYVDAAQKYEIRMR